MFAIWRITLPHRLHAILMKPTTLPERLDSLVLPAASMAPRPPTRRRLTRQQQADLLLMVRQRHARRREKAGQPDSLSIDSLLKKWRT